VIWSHYGECRGKPPGCEVVIRCDATDRDHPWVLQRKAMYEREGRRVLLVTRPGKRRGGSRPDAAGEARR